MKNIRKSRQIPLKEELDKIMTLAIRVAKQEISFAATTAPPVSI
jgi:hypothetical protein